MSDSSESLSDNDQFPGISKTEVNPEVQPKIKNNQVQEKLLEAAKKIRVMTHKSIDISQYP